MAGGSGHGERGTFQADAGQRKAQTMARQMSLYILASGDGNWQRVLQGAANAWAHRGIIRSAAFPIALKPRNRGEFAEALGLRWHVGDLYTYALGDGQEVWIQFDARIGNLFIFAIEANEEA